MYFEIYNGVRQGENLSPVLFCMLLNDLNDFLEDHGCSGLNFEIQHGDILTFLKLLTLLYADDTVIFATDPATFQRNLNVFLEYTKLWKLDVNYLKTKVMIFGFRNLVNFRFELDGNTIEIVDTFKYLGVYFSKSRTFYKAQKHCYDQGKKAMHLLKRIHTLNIPLDLQLKLFDDTIVPILLYGSEVWGFENTGTLCQTNKLGDEFHYLFECPTFDLMRSQYIPKFYVRRPNIYKFDLLFNNCNINILKKLSKFIKNILKAFQ